MWYIFIFLIAVCNAEQDKEKTSFSCNETVTGNETDIGYLVPGNISDKTVCIWTLNKTKEVFLVFEKFQLHEDENVTISSVDYLFSGHKTPFSVLIQNGSIVITLKLKSIHESVKQRLRIYFNSESCSYNLTSSVNSISSPLYHPAVKNQCVFHIPVAGDDYMLSIVFDQFQLNKSLLAIEGTDTPLNYSGTEIPPDAFGHKAMTLTLQFAKDSTNDTFTISVYHVLKACSGFFHLNDTARSVEVKGSPSAQQSVTEAECRYVIQSDINSVIGFTFKRLILLNSFDHLSFNDGPSMRSQPLLLINSLNQNTSTDQYIRSSRNYIFISFKPSDKQSDFVGTAEMYKNDKHVYSAEGNISLPLSNSEPRVIFLIDTPIENKQVLLKLNANGTNLLPGATLKLFSDFGMHSSPIAILRQNKVYPVITTGPKMMVIADNITKSGLLVHYESILPGCYEMSSKNSGTYSLSGHCNETCSWIMNPNIITNDVLALDISKVRYGDRVNVTLLDANMTALASFTQSDTFIPEIYIPANVGASITVERGGECLKNDTALFFANYVIKKSCSEVHEYNLPQSYQIKSPNYPNTYPALADCWWNLTSPSSGYALLTFTKLQLASGHCIQVFSHKNGTNITLVGNYSSQVQLPDDMFTELNISLHFKSSLCNRVQKETAIATAPGYLLNLTATDCGGLYTGLNGNFSTSVNKTLCIWVVKVPLTDDKKDVNIIKFKILTKNTNIHNELKVYDGSSLRSPLIDNITGAEIWSRNNTLIFVYHNLTKTSSEINITYTTEACNSSSLCDNGLCLHPDWRCNGIDNCGDYSDEQNCSSIPDHGGSGSNTNSAGVSPVAFGVVIPIIFAAGILCAIGVPFLLRRYRGGRYQQFRDVSVTD